MKEIKTFLSIIISLLLLSPAISGKAADPAFSTEDHEIVFLLDASNSMAAQDKEGQVGEAIRQMAYSLPFHCKAGFVAYDTDIQSVMALGRDMDQLEDRLEAVEYKGYTNAGEGLSQALALFSDEKNTRRSVIMISDGEIDMGNDIKTQESREKFFYAANRAITMTTKVYIIAMGNELDANMLIFYAAQLTDGAIYWEGQTATLPQIANQILFDRLRFPAKSVGTADFTEGGIKTETAASGSFRVEIPAAGADRVRILLTGSRGLEQVKSDYLGKYGRIISGRSFAMVDLERPSSGEVDVRFQSPGDSDVQAYVMTEYRAEVVADRVYRSEETVLPEKKDKKTPPVYKHFADITIKVVESGGGTTGLWDDGRYEGMEIPFTVNGDSYMGRITGGSISHSMPIDGFNKLSITLDTTYLPETYFMEQPKEVALLIPPDPIPEPEPDYRTLWGILGVLTAAPVLITFFRIKKKHSGRSMAAQPSASEPGDGR